MPQKDRKRIQERETWPNPNDPNIINQLISLSMQEARSDAASTAGSERSVSRTNYHQERYRFYRHHQKKITSQFFSSWTNFTVLGNSGFIANIAAKLQLPPPSNPEKLQFSLGYELWVAFREETSGYGDDGLVYREQINPSNLERAKKIREGFHATKSNVLVTNLPASQLLAKLSTIKASVFHLITLSTDEDVFSPELEALIAERFLSHADILQQDQTTNVAIINSLLAQGQTYPKQNLSADITQHEKNPSPYNPPIDTPTVPYP